MCGICRHSTDGAPLRFNRTGGKCKRKFRYVDLDALKAHRQENIRVLERQQRDEPAESVSAAPADLVGAPASVAPVLQGEKNLKDANLRLKQLQVREAELDLAEREGRVIPAEQVQTMLSAVAQTITAELERQEQALTLRFGREVGLAIRASRKDALQKASDKLVELAQAHLKPALGLEAA